ncbi:MAG TPA: metallophosphoesterase family protein [Candidatus Binatia bacterium]|nr:metallophosphoesterase family protein [Candidatus Binatia bacterium]
MRIAALHDIHGNLPALEAVLGEVEAAGVDRIVLGGDVSLGPMPTETLEVLWKLGDRVVALHGNTDREQVTVFDGGAPNPRLPDDWREATIWTGRVLERRHRDYLAGLPPTLTFDVDRVGRVLFCHATPQNDLDVFTSASAEERVAPMLAGVDADLVVCGHTHMQFDRRFGGVRVVNAGSVGMPFAEPGAYWLLLGPVVELRHTRYDLEAAAARIRATAYPMAEQFAAGNVLQPPSTEDMTARYEQAVAGQR